jgi:hypothetical protein
MVAIAESSPSVASHPGEACTGEGASSLAVACLQWASACWRGERRATIFANQLSAYWCLQLPPQPVGIPDAISPHGGGGRGIHWYETGDEIRGYVPGVGGGYRVPIQAVPRLVRCMADEPCAYDKAGVPALLDRDTVRDRLLSAVTYNQSSGCSS